MLRGSSALGTLLVALTLLAACGGDDDREQAGCRSDVAGAAGVRLSYAAAKGQATAQELRATADKLCARLEGTGDERPAVDVVDGRVVVVVPPGTPGNLIDYIGSPGRLVIYDWEPVILDEDCKTDPMVNANERRPIFGRGAADKLAAKCGDGAIVVRQERANPQQPKTDAWWVIRDEPVLDGEDIVGPESDADEQTNEPIVVMDFTEPGKRKFAAVTREVARRGQDTALPGMQPTLASNHFAIALDDELVSTPFIDFTENPDGIDGETGMQISGGFTEESARVLARLLALGPLPLELKLVERRDQR